MQITLASASGHIALRTAMPPIGSREEAGLAEAIGLAKRAAVHNHDGDVYLDSPLAPEAEDDRGDVSVAEATDLIRTWAGV